MATGPIQDLFPAKSLFCLTLSNPIRRAAIKIITWKWFERFSILMIVINSIALVLTDPCDFKCRKPLCVTMEIVESVIFSFFATEMLIKMVAMGVFGKKAYFGDSWNRFDCFIVIVGTAEFVFSNQEINLSAIRAIRVLRPLRAINRISSLRLLVTLLLDILPMLGNVMIFCFFIFFVFGIVSVQLWAGLLRHRCFFPKHVSSDNTSVQPPPFMPPFYRQPHREYICSPATGQLKCKNIPDFEKFGSMCADMFGSDETKLLLCRRWVANYTDCRPGGPNPARGTLNFDNIGYAWIAIFQVISLESWAEVMYLVQDSFSFWVWIFFVSLVLVGSYLAVNLSLVVIATQFSETKARENERMKQERMAEMESSEGSFVSNLSSNGLYGQLINLILHYCRRLGRKVFKKKANLKHLSALAMPVKVDSTVECPACRHRIRTSIDARRPSVAPNTTRPKCPMCGFNPRGLVVTLEEKKSRTFSQLITASRRWLRRLLEHDICVATVMGTIVVNAVVMALEHHNQPVELTIFIETMNLIFTFIFVLELIIKLYAYGPEEFIREAFNMMDAIVIIINIAELFSSDGESGGSGFAVLRLFRLVRIVKIIRFLPALQKQLRVMIAVVDHVATFFLLLGFFLFISSLLGMSLFGCKFCETVHKAPSPPSNNTDSEICQYQIFTSENDTLELSSLSRQIVGTSSVEDINPNHAGCSVANFNSPFQSSFTVLQVFTQDDWGSVMQDGMHFTSHWAGIYFVALVTIGNYIIFNLLVAILVEGFSSENNDAECQNETLALIRRKTFVRVETTDEAEAARELFDIDEDQTEQLHIRHRFSKFTGGLMACWNAEISDRSLFIFPKDSALRKNIRKMFASQVYDKIFLFVVLGSCSLIVIERPGIGKDSVERRVLTIGNYVFTGIFLLEATAKILAHGFCLGRRTYLRSAWNALDFFLIFIAILDIALDFTDVSTSNKKIIHALRILRLLRALRPLRIITRSNGLQIVIQTLLISIKPIGNIILICCFFFAIFAILGVQLFSGCYARCLAPKIETLTNSTFEGMPSTESYSEWAVEVLEKVQNRNDCLVSGLQWETDSYNFNSLPEALMALFVFATLDGWTDITRNGVDCVGIDKQPIRDYNMWAYGYFISFLLIVCFFALNMFVGVVVNNFQNVQRQVAEVVQKRAMENIKSFCEIGIGITVPESTLTPDAKRKSDHPDELLPDLDKYPGWRQQLYFVVSHKTFEFVVIAATFANVIMMTVEFYNMPEILRETIATAGYVFMTLLVLEIALKVVAYGPALYASNRWNQVDLVICCLSILGIVLEELPEDLVPLNPEIVTFPRVFRIIRILKLLKSASGVRQLLETLSEAIPQVLNLSLLFLLLFFIYASLGVELYGRFDCHFEVCEGLSRHANFKHFGMSLLTLFRIFTGDNWNGILKDILWMSGDPKQCSNENEDGSDGGGISCSLTHLISPVYFISFVLLAQFILINVVVAALMSQLEDANKRDKDELAVRESQNVRPGEIADEMIASSDLMYGSNAASSIDLYDDGHITINVISSIDLAEADAASVVSAEYVLQHQDICDAEYLSLKLRSLIVDTDSAVVSDLTISPLSPLMSPNGSPTRTMNRGGNGNFHSPAIFNSLEKPRVPAFKSPKGSLENLHDKGNRSVSFVKNIAMVPGSMDTRRAKFASRLPVLPESPGSIDQS